LRDAHLGGLFPRLGGGVLDELAADRGELGEVGAEGVDEGDERLGLDAALRACELRGDEGLLVAGALDGARVDSRHAGLLQGVQQLLAAVAAAVHEHQRDVLLGGLEVVSSSPTRESGAACSSGTSTKRGSPNSEGLATWLRVPGPRASPESSWTATEGPASRARPRRRRTARAAIRVSVQRTSTIGATATLCHSTSLTASSSLLGGLVDPIGPGRCCAAATSRRPGGSRSRARRCAGSGCPWCAAGRAARR